MSEGPLLLSDRISEDFRALETDCHRAELEQFEDADPWIIFFLLTIFRWSGSTSTVSSGQKIVTSSNKETVGCRQKRRGFRKRLRGCVCVCARRMCDTIVAASPRWCRLVDESTWWLEEATSVFWRQTARGGGDRRASEYFSD